MGQDGMGASEISGRGGPCPSKSKRRDRGLPKDRGWGCLEDRGRQDGVNTQHVSRGRRSRIRPGVGMGPRVYHLGKEMLALVQSGKSGSLTQDQLSSSFGASWCRESEPGDP